MVRITVQLEAEQTASTSKMFKVIVFATLLVLASAAPEAKPKPGVIAAAYTAPVVSTYTAPAVSTYTAPVVSAYSAPVVPAYHGVAPAPILSAYSAPVVSGYHGAVPAVAAAYHAPVVF